MNREQLKSLLQHRGLIVADKAVIAVEDLVREAAQAERHRIYAALEADPGALWRDQGFQEWRKNRQESDGR